MKKARTVTPAVMLGRCNINKKNYKQVCCRQGQLMPAAAAPGAQSYTRGSHGSHHGTHYGGRLAQARYTSRHYRQSEPLTQECRGSDWSLSRCPVCSFSGLVHEQVFSFCSLGHRHGVVVRRCFRLRFSIQGVCRPLTFLFGVCHPIMPTFPCAERSLPPFLFRL